MSEDDKLFKDVIDGFGLEMQRPKQPSLWAWLKRKARAVGRWVTWRLYRRRAAFKKWQHLMGGEDGHKSYQSWYDRAVITSGAPAGGLDNIITEPYPDIDDREPVGPRPDTDDTGTN